MERLAMLRGQARFPLYALHPARWEGDRSIAMVGRENIPIAGLHTVQMLYAARDERSGVLVSNISARVATGPEARAADRMTLHLEGFVRRFGAGSGRRWFREITAVRSRDFTSRERVLMVAGAERAVNWLTHASLPLEVFDTAIRDDVGICDLVIAGWNHPVRDLARDLQPVTAELADAFDRSSIDEPSGDLEHPL